MIKFHFSGNDPDAISLTISREANTCDPKDYVIDEGTTHVLYLIDDQIWAKDKIDGFDTNKIKIKGFNRVQLIKVRNCRDRSKQFDWE